MNSAPNQTGQGGAAASIDDVSRACAVELFDRFNNRPDLLSDTAIAAIIGRHMAPLLADRMRLDWLESSSAFVRLEAEAGEAFGEWVVYQPEFTGNAERDEEGGAYFESNRTGESLRAAVDAAMKRR
jgi:hypothetical protein